MSNQVIVIESDDKEFTFNVTTQAYNKYLNSASPNNKIQPATNFLMGTVKDEQKQELKTFLKLPGASLLMAGIVVDEYQPEFNLSVKKSKSAPNK
ncbi:putative phage tail assembly chaperone [Pseudoalteromonas sp. S16_S37]|uniref:putative phage tail assembly chaperone n=1 Tax=Pseudoalteromonas sp. S16_S37 TaxID=2720228 RepID=UPI00167FE89B|nr:putative phage tail assembly chaperone [Pseudoalteromonas sp. S16_S37]MBD1582799.1 hypothetical protein [Pseudoalteromonas sp. S16_S37]